MEVRETIANVKGA